MIGHRFTRWLVLAEIPERRNGKRCYQCRCDCGAESICVAGNLRSGISKSCGCLKSERIHDAKFVHGRDTSDRTYQCWSSMRDRCNNPSTRKYNRYGGRGIRVCDRWGSFPNFLSDMGECPPRLTLERKNNDGNYEPSNCRWATRREQSLNKSTTRHVTAFGETKPLTVWTEEKQISFLAVWKRLKRGWPAERALTEPVKNASRIAA